MNWSLFLKVTGLKPQQKYFFRVRAENAAGVSEPADQVGPLLADDPHGNHLHRIFTVTVAKTTPELHSPSLSPSTVAPSLDLSAFRNGLEVIVPQPLTIRVPIGGYPIPAAKWSFGDQALSPEQDRVSMLTRPTFTELTVSPSVRPDKGTYTLTLENNVSCVSGEIEVNVIGEEHTFTVNRPNPE